MTELRDLIPGVRVRGVSPDGPVEVVAVKWFGESAIDLTYKVLDTGFVGTRLLYRDDESDLEMLERGPRWSFAGDGQLFRLASEARRIQLAHLLIPFLPFTHPTWNRCPTRSRPYTTRCCPSSPSGFFWPMIRAPERRLWRDC